jgi:hypothetical protein
MLCMDICIWLLSWHLPANPFRKMTPMIEEVASTIMGAVISFRVPCDARHMQVHVQVMDMNMGMGMVMGMSIGMGMGRGIGMGLGMGMGLGTDTKITSCPGNAPAATA